MSENKKTPQDVLDQGERVTYYVSERIVNIADLETLISQARFSLLNLDAFVKTTQDLNGKREVIAEEVEFAKELLEKALGFRFLIERRKTFIENDHPC